MAIESASPPRPSARSEHVITVSTTEPAIGGPTTVHLSGELDMLTSTALNRRLRQALRHSADGLILDLSRMSFCDASGLGVLIDIQNRARSRGIALTLAAPRPSMSRLLRITGLDRSFTLTA